jgi:hypothetical protein
LTKNTSKPRANKDAQLTEAKRKELAESYAQQALALLHQAVKLGFKDVALMKKGFRSRITAQEKRVPEAARRLGGG